MTSAVAFAATFAVTFATASTVTFAMAFTFAMTFAVTFAVTPAIAIWPLQNNNKSSVSLTMNDYFVLIIIHMIHCDITETLFTTFYALIL